MRERTGQGNGKQLERRILSLCARANADLDDRVAFRVMRDLAAHSRALGQTPRATRTARPARSLDQTLLDEPGIGPISAAKLLACDPTRVKNGGCLCALQRHRAHPGLVRKHPPLPPEPRRRPSSLQRHPPDRDQAPTRDSCLPPNIASGAVQSVDAFGSLSLAGELIAAA